MKEAQADGREVHFGSLMELCSIKNSQLEKEFWTYKGRIVFRGDIVKDEHGQFAVFTEQGTSASHMAAAKFMDVCPDCLAKVEKIVTQAEHMHKSHSRTQ